MPLNPQLLDESLAPLLRRELTCARNLETLLDRESHCMETHNLEDLQQAGVHKLSVSEELRRIGLQRDSLLTDNGFTAGRAGLNELCDARPAGISTPLWRELQEIIAHCQEKNRRIGAAIHRAELTTSRALQILKQGYLDDVQLYGATGDTHAGTRAQRVAKA